MLQGYDDTNRGNIMNEDFDRKLEQIRAARVRQEARHAKRVRALLENRTDLHGVHALADLVVERVLWCA
jgi:hypothetical protein